MQKLRSIVFLRIGRNNAVKTAESRRRDVEQTGDEHLGFNDVGRLAKYLTASMTSRTLVGSHS
jgi:hypothetical protein